MFITLEGMEGAGKSTLRQALHQKIMEQGRQVMITHEPGGCALGLKLRQILLHDTMNLTPQAELLLFLADRAQHVAEVIRPALAEGKVVICDRYADSTIVYQGYGRGLDIDQLYELNDLATQQLWPDCTLILDLPTCEGLERVQQRELLAGGAGFVAGNDSATKSAATKSAATKSVTAKPIAADRFETLALDFHEKIRQGFLTWAVRANAGLSQPRLHCLDASQNPEQVLAAAWSIINKLKDHAGIV